VTLKTLMRAPSPSAERKTATPSTLSGSQAALAIGGWLSGVWALDPFFVLLTTFVYAPYFAAGIVSDPARGQALWGFAASGAGLAVAILSPVLGAFADAGGRRKPWIAGFGAMLMAGASLLWFGRPNDPASIVPVLAAYGFGVAGAECVLVFLNAMMPMLVPPERLGRLSGTGAATAYLGGLASLLLTLGWLAASPQTGRTLLGFSPLLGLDPAQRQGDRVAGPLAAIWFLAFSLPLFLFTPDPPRKTSLRIALRSGLATLAGTLAGLRRHRNLTAFLIANMVYSDGLVALFAFGGIYAAGTFGWRTIEVGVFGMLLLVAGIFGAFLAGRLDDRFGPKSVIVASLGVLISAGIAILSVGRDHILFVITVAPPHSNQGLYASTPERAFVAIGLLIGAVAGPLQAASRSLLARLAPPDRVTQHFGLLALSGKVTSFVGPFLVGLVTAATASQRAGMAVLLAFFLTGLAAISRVRVSRA
jgi:MFS transporter, UMF1 family